jgi:putative DNA primase/helicase
MPRETNVVALAELAEKLKAAGSDNRPAEFSDDALALRFAEKHGTELRYVDGWGRWLRWDACCWTFDDTLRVFDESRKTCRDAAATCKKPKNAAVITSAKTVAAVEKLARCDRRIAATVDQWDSNSSTFNTRGS